MKNAIDLFSELGKRLSQFGANAVSRHVIEQAQAANEWFTAQDIKQAVSAFRTEMLQRDKLEKWLCPYPLPTATIRRVLVVMAGNIPLVGFYDLLCTLAVGDHCVVKPSSKDSVLMVYIVELLREINPEVAISFYVEGEDVDAVIATGGENANRYFKAHFATLPSLLRGSRQSVAVITGTESLAQLQGLSDDVFAYSGLGCRNVSLLFVPRGYTKQLQMPPMNTKYHNNYLQTRALLKIAGQPFCDLGSAVMVEQRAFPMALSQVNYTFYDNLSEVATWLAAHDTELQCVVSEGLHHARRVDFGHAQLPTLTDCPDERDVVDFLLRIN
ncbi:MAG: acyl-CoA reductase [Alistipes sp.]